MCTLKRLVEGPSFKATSYYAYEANGYQFCTAQSESTKTTQNSGVTIKALTKFRSNTRDKNHVEGEAIYYEATDDAKAPRIKGKQSRMAAKAQHKSGRKGAARIAYEMEKKYPDIPVIRTRLFMALHTKSDGSCPTQEHSPIVDQIKEIADKDPSSTLLDVDHDPVAQVYGPEVKGRVRACGTGVSKRGIDASALARHQLKRQKQYTSALEDKVSSMNANV
ncbi:hypothetical protein FRX31_014683 [Thalictrum thalictroides]|uniref:Uncharacterized protein n=1 Tax=Thalictrum thalictroides TaxID=46969 RepID=A0A7J6WGH9_THATH|nr:hypothetical protein FRX31_014683 [Thalictrum thalictroides]